MKNSLEKAPARNPSPQVAWGLLTTNLGLPGVGSLLAGRKVGVPQLILSLTALILTVVFGLKFILWYFANRKEMSDPYADPFVTLKAMWLAVRWAVLGMALFALSVAWAFITSWSVLRRAKQFAPPQVSEKQPP
jgi:hypothetical protein